MNQPTQPPIRKRLLTEEPERDSALRLDLATHATVFFTSEDPLHPVDNLLDDRRGPGGTFWASARTGTTEQIVLEFDAPQRISRLVYEVEQRLVETTQEVRIEVSSDGGRTYRQLVVQGYTFSPQGATFQREDLTLNAEGVTHLRLTVVAEKSRAGKATMSSLSLFA